MPVTNPAKIFANIEERKGLLFISMTEHAHAIIERINIIPKIQKCGKLAYSLIFFHTCLNLYFIFSSFIIFSGSSNRGKQHPCWHTIFRLESLVCYTFVKLWLPDKKLPSGLICNFRYSGLKGSLSKRYLKGQN